LTCVLAGGHNSGVVDRVRRHRRGSSRLALGLLILTAELAGRSLTHRINVGSHVGPVSYAENSYYPFLLAFVKTGIALLAARVAWRFARAFAAARSVGASPTRGARVSLGLSWRLWLGCFLGTATVYLVQTDAETVASGRWPLLFPWLHSSALPVFAVLAVLVAVLYRAVRELLLDVERIAAVAVARARTRGGRKPPGVTPRADVGDHGPRSRFGLAFESRPPPLPA
jgi:hypothetical protein